MKKTILKTALFFGLITILSCCESKRPESPVAGKTDNNGVRCGTIETPLDTAISCINRYDSLWTALFKTGEPPIRAYTIRAQDLLESMGMSPSYASDSTICKFNHVRVYIGLDANYKFKLYFTPVKNADLCNGNGGMDVILPDSISSTPQYVLDLNAPCPNTCGSPGPLYQ